MLNACLGQAGRGYICHDRLRRSEATAASSTGPHKIHIAVDGLVRSPLSRKKSAVLTTLTLHTFGLELHEKHAHSSGRAKTGRHPLWVAACLEEIFKWHTYSCVLSWTLGTAYIRVTYTRKPRGLEVRQREVEVLKKVPERSPVRKHFRTIGKGERWKTIA